MLRDEPQTPGSRRSFGFRVVEELDGFLCEMLIDDVPHAIAFVKPVVDVLPWLSACRTGVLSS